MNRGGQCQTRDLHALLAFRLSGTRPARFWARACDHKIAANLSGWRPWVVGDVRRVRGLRPPVLGQHRSTLRKIAKTPDDEAALTADMVAIL